MNNKILKLWLLVALIPLLLLISLLGNSCQTSPVSPGPEAAVSNPVTGINIGNLAPDFTLPDMKGESVSLSDFHSRPVLLNFWASWCGPCRFEMPFLQEISEDQKWQNAGLEVLTINLTDSPEVVLEYFMENNLSLPVLIDVNQEVGQLYNVRNIPMTYLIDADGIIKATVIGAFPDKAEIEKRLKEITGK
ncbi:peroxiredoxin family protein [Chloroflexota bacterium]